MSAPSPDSQKSTLIPASTETPVTSKAAHRGSGIGFTPVMLEFRKLLGFRSVRLGFVVAFLLPFLLSLAPQDQLKLIAGTDVILASAWQVPGLALYIVMQFVLPLLVAVTCAELIGGEVAWGTLRPLLLRPVSRFQIIGSKLFVAILYPFLLLAITMIGGLIAGIPRGLGGFYGGTGLGPGVFTGIGYLAPLDAFLELARAYWIAGLVLAPIAAMAVAFAVAYLNTAAAALATISTILLMRMLIVFPQIKILLLTEHLNAYAPGMDTNRSLVLLAIYTVMLAGLTMFMFEKKDL
jgi:ABC-2 type transport system permease protein